MSLELPVLRLGLAGFSPEEQNTIGRCLRVLGEGSVWELSSLDLADAWWLQGGKTHLVDGERIRVNPGAPSARTIQLHLPDVDKPIAFATPTPPGLDPLYSFDAASPDSMAGVLGKFEAWLAPVAALFCLAAHVLEHQAVLGMGVYELRNHGNLVAVVDMKGNVAVRSTAGVIDFENSLWRTRTVAEELPDNFVRTSLSQLMWQYALRTQRDMLPAHYRKGLLYFRRPPRMPQRLLGDAHLLLMRQLSVAPAAFRELQRLCNMEEEQLARHLAALYVVGSITSNPKRAANPPPHIAEPAVTARVWADAPDTDTGLFGNTRPPDSTLRRTSVAPEEMTAPAPLR